MKWIHQSSSDQSENLRLSIFDLWKKHTATEIIPE